MIKNIWYAILRRIFKPKPIVRPLYDPGTIVDLRKPQGNNYIRKMRGQK